MKFTAGFSNTPGPLKPFMYKDKKTGEVMRGMTSHAYVMLAGNFGFVLSALSSNDKVAFTLVTDDYVADYGLNKQLAASVHRYIQTEIDLYE